MTKIDRSQMWRYIDCTYLLYFPEKRKVSCMFTYLGHTTTIASERFWLDVHFTHLTVKYIPFWYLLKQYQSVVNDWEI